MAGAVCGYWASWFLGRRLGYRAAHRRPFVRHRRGIARARLYFLRWGGVSLVAGRYALGPFQSMLPLVAGMVQMDARRFHRWNVVSGILWIALVLTPGFLLGRGITGLDRVWQDRFVAGSMMISGTAIVAGVLLAQISVRRSRQGPSSARPGSADRS